MGLSFSDMLLCSRLTMGTVHKYNQLMKDFPLDDLLSSTDLNVQELPMLIFSHRNRKLKLLPYPVELSLEILTMSFSRS